MIQELMITDKNGLCYFYYNFIKKKYVNKNHYLIASFLDQLCSIFKLSLKNDIGLVKLNRIMFSFYEHPKSNLRLILKCDNNYKENDNDNHIKRSLDIIAKRLMDLFFREYKSVLEKFNGNIKPFAPFTEIIDSVFAIKI